MELIQDLFTESQYQQHQLGALYIAPNGDKYRYAKAGGSALVTGNLLQEPVEDTNFRSMVCYANAAIGATQVQVTLGGTAVTAGLFDEGLLAIESGTGIGQKFRIKSHDVQTSTTGVLTVTLDRPLKIAIVATTTQITIRKNPYNGVIQYPVTTQTGGAVGVAQYAMTASYYGWIQSGGDAYCLFDTGGNTANDASAVSPSAAVAGSVKVSATSTPIIGYSREVVSVDSTMGLVHLQID